MNCYQKFYTNQIHSSSLLCQLATMWKSQVLCDAIIRSGSVITKAHRVVLVAACPMLQSMENAAVGSHLEVRLASDIKQESVQMFLQYLYEGFMMLTEQNCRDVEKIARLLQVDSIIKCCADFNKCLASKTGNMSATDQYKYTFHDMVEFKHVRSSDLQKTMQDRMVKRGSEFSHPSSPSTKRSRTQEVMDDTVTGCYGNVAPDPWDRVPRLGMPSHSRGGSTSHPGVVDIVGDGIELIQTDPPDSNAGNRHSDRRISQKTVSIAVASQINSTTDLQVVDVAEKSKTESRSGNTSTMTSHGRVNTADPSPSSVPETSKSSNSYNSSSSFSKQISPSFPSVSTDKFHMGSPPVLSPTHAQISSRSSPQFASTSSKSDAGPKPFAAGSESQSTVPQQSSYSGEYSEKNSSEPSPDTGPKEISDTSQQRPSRTASASSKQEADIAIVKIESEDEDDTGGLEMYVNMPDGGEIRVQRTEHDEEGDPQAEWGREENEDSNVSGDQNNSWLFAQSQFKEEEDDIILIEPVSVESDDIWQSKSFDQRPATMETGERLTEGKQYLAGTVLRTKRDVRILKNWLLTNGFSSNIEAMSAVELDSCLGQFYTKLRTKDGMPYNKATLNGIRASINRYLSSLESDQQKCILQQPEFASSNNILKQMSNHNKSIIKKVMTMEDIHKMMTSDAISVSSPVTLVRKVWLDLSLHFGLKGKEPMRTLSKESILFQTDEVGRNYVCLNRQLEMPKIDRFSEMRDWHWGGRMYAVESSPFCPVRSLHMYLSKLSRSCGDLFQRPMENPTPLVWYGGVMGHASLLRMMTDISEQANLSVSYTNICLKATVSRLLQNQYQDSESRYWLGLQMKGHFEVDGKPLPTNILYRNSAIFHELLYGICYKGNV